MQPNSLSIVKSDVMINGQPEVTDVLSVLIVVVHTDGCIVQQIDGIGEVNQDHHQIEWEVSEGEQVPMEWVDEK